MRPTPEQAARMLVIGEEEGMADPRALWSLFVAEGGVKGREFNYGIQKGSKGWFAPAKVYGFERQARLAAHQFKLVEDRYREATGQSPIDAQGNYNDFFLRYFSAGGQGYPGYAPLADPRDTSGLNLHHFNNLATEYKGYTQGKPYKVPKQESALETIEPTGDALVEYGRSRMREEDLRLVNDIAGPSVADEVGNFRQLEYENAKLEGKSTLRRAMDYVIDPVVAGLGVLHDISSRFRGAIAGKGFEPATGEDITHLKNEPITPEIKDQMLRGAFVNQLFPFLLVPRRTVNELVEFATDPFVLLGAGPIGSASKLAKASKGIQPEIAAPVTAGERVAGVQPSASAPATAPESALTRIGPPKPINPELEAQFPSLREAQELAGVRSHEIESGLERLKEAATPLDNIAPTPELFPGPNSAQVVLTGFGRYVRSKAPEGGLPSLTAEKIAEGKQLDMQFEQIKELTSIPKQQKLALDFKQTVDMDTLFVNARKDIEQSTLTDPQTRAAAQYLLDSSSITPHKIIHPPATGIPEQARVVAENAIHRSVLEPHMKAIEAYSKTPTPELREKIIADMAHVVAVTKRIRMNEAERAAALRMAKTGQAPEVKAFEDLMENLPEGTSFERYVGIMKMMQTDAQRIDMMKGMGGVGPVKGSIIQIMLNGLISGTALPIWNFAAGVSLFGAKVLERWRMAGYEGSGVASGEAGVMAWGFLKSYWELMTASAKLGRNLTEREVAATKRFGQDFSRATEIFKEEGANAKLGVRRSISARNYGMEDSVYSPAIDYLGHFINIPTFIVGSSDAFLRFATRQAFIEAAAFREATADVAAQLAVGKQLNKAQASELMATRRAELLANPNQKVMVEGQLRSLQEIGDDSADLLAMMTQLRSGTLGHKINEALSDSVLGRSIAPFFRVTYLSGREALIRTPILNRLAPSVRADLAAGGERAAKANAQLSTGYMLAATATTLTSLGYMSGDGPVDPEARRLWSMTHTPNSLQIPGTDVVIPYTRLGPVGQVMRFMSNTAYMVPRLADSESIATDLSTTMAVVFASLLSDQNFNKDMNELFASLSMRDTKALNRFIEHRVTAFVPYSGLLRQVNKQIQGEQHIADGALARATMLIPGLNGTTYYDQMGDAAEVPNDSVWDGIKNNTGFINRPQADPVKKLVLDTLDEHRITFTGPDRIHEGVKLELEEFMRLRRIFGHEVKGPNGTLVEGLRWLINLPMYQRATDGPKGGKQTMLNTLVGAYKEAAFNQLINEKNTDGTFKYQDFRKQMEDARAYKYHQERGVEIQPR